MKGKKKIKKKKTKLKHSACPFCREFSDGRREGKGVMTSINGDRYEGEWREGILWGFGKARRANGQTYIGEFVNGEKDGTGVLTFENGYKYEGGI